jgi:hypothetical protein
MEFFLIKRIFSGKYKFCFDKDIYKRVDINSFTKKFLEYKYSPEVQMNIVIKLWYISI